MKAWRLPINIKKQRIPTYDTDGYNIKHGNYPVNTKLLRLKETQRRKDYPIKTKT